MPPHPPLAQPGDDIDIVDNPASERYEAWLNGELAGLIAYMPEDGWLVFGPTQGFQGFEGRGIGCRRARGALDAVRARGRSVTPQCPFVSAYIKRHPDYRALVVGRR